MEKPESLVDFYESLENIESLSIWNIQTSLKTAAGFRESNFLNQVISERKALSYNISNGTLESNAQFVDKNGNIQRTELTQDDIDYLKQRLEETSNSILKARYAHLIWQECKHKKYSKIALENYIESINLIKAKEIRELSVIISAITHLSHKTKELQDESRQIIFQLSDELPIWLKSNILRLILESKLFRKSELNEIARRIPDWLEENNPTSYFANKTILELCLILHEKVNIPNENIYERLAINENVILDEHPKEEDFVRFTTIGNKARLYRKAGKIEKSNELFKEYNRLKQKVKLSHVQYTLDDEHTEMFNKFLKWKSEIILSWPTDSILAYFSVDEEILVDPEKNENIAKQGMRNSIYSLFKTSVFDINSNYRELTDNEKMDKEIAQSYTLSLGVGVESLFQKVFTEGIIAGKLNYYKIYQYLEEHTWFNLKFKRSMSLRESDKDTSWLTLLAPGIQNLFSQYEHYILMNTNKVNNLVLALDSLTLKFEGLLRDFIRLCGGYTTTEKRGVLREQLFKELLENDVITKHFSIKDIALFKHCFTKKGKNIRNNIAHSFMEFSDYTLQSALLVFFCILRISKYTFEEKS